jgi:hypothetical protein
MVRDVARKRELQTGASENKMRQIDDEDPWVITNTIDGVANHRSPTIRDSFSEFENMTSASVAPNDSPTTHRKF